MLDASVGKYFPGFGYKCVHHGNESLCWVLVPHKQHSVANSTSVYSKVRHGANIRLAEYWISGKYAAGYLVEYVITEEMRVFVGF